ncbi:hypothetical protein IQ268_10035 [Oculatella sp. LEGE 06141]|uniref:hypothetical protein n=1 Tax=Oculatella sp. LEGE 06141 TaxID=1828648 RepID=UPI0018820A6F|nr:hypothetical protein [Oculatella sp. LEGE 06141]MBE9178899.1 hypothetical protein [Oculatella sp. LEGE 06141]
MSTMNLVQTNGSSALVNPPVWLRASVQEFFTTFNWDDSPPEVQELKLNAMEEGTPLSMTLSVSQFFGAVAWDGAAIAAPPLSDSPTVLTDAKDFTLDDFSDLF